MRACRANYRLSIRVRSVGLRGPLIGGEPTRCMSRLWRALQFSLQYSPPTVVRYASSGTVEVASSAQELRQEAYHPPVFFHRAVPLARSAGTWPRPRQVRRRSPGLLGKSRWLE